MCWLLAEGPAAKRPALASLKLSPQPKLQLLRRSRRPPVSAGRMQAELAARVANGLRDDHRYWELASMALWQELKRQGQGAEIAIELHALFPL